MLFAMSASSLWAQSASEDSAAKVLTGAAQRAAANGAIASSGVTETPANGSVVVDDLGRAVGATNATTTGSKEIRAENGTVVVQQTPSEFESFVSDLLGEPVRRFGSELLVPSGHNFTSPPNISIPPDYRINAGDEVLLGLTGSVVASDLRLVVDHEGRIFVPKVGAITLAGVPYNQLQAVIGERVARQYRNFTLTVSLGSLHGITVYVTGFAARPGSYTVSSLSTVVNAVLLAGGPASGGSFRSVQVRRAGRLISDLDMYDFLLRGDKSRDIVLENGDVLTIAPSGPQVAVIGSVNREAIYEARKSDTLNDVLLYAGGANTVADLDRVHLLDPMAAQGWQQLTPQDIRKIDARRGLVLRVLPAVGLTQPAERRQSLVTVSGEVKNPGRYFVAPGTTLDQVVEMAGGLTSNAYVFGSVFIRDSLRREQKANFDAAIDQMSVTLSVQPLVRAQTTIQEGGFYGQRAAVLQDVISRLKTQRVDGRLVMPMHIGDTGLPGSFAVENNDQLFIPNQKLEVGVFGFVNSAADFRYVAGRKVRDYITLAGGYARYADKHGVFVVRANGTVLPQHAAMTADALPGDLIFVPVNADKGEVWSKIKDLSGVLFSGLVAGAAVKAILP